MHSAIRRGVTVGIAASGVLAGSASAALASTTATGESAGSPGIASGNTVQAPVDVPINVCGNSVNVLGLLNLNVGNHCANDSSSGSAQSGSAATGSSHDSPGVIAGNTIEAPVNVPVDVCGNSVNVLSAGNGTSGNACENGAASSHPAPPAPTPSGPAPTSPAPTSSAPTPATVTVARTSATGELAHTGAQDAYLAPTAGALLLGGGLLLRRGRHRLTRG
jgi:LPXTG-motif cell wall-anchored protein